MSLNGDFATMPLPDLLQWLAISQKTGILLLQRGEVIKEMYFRRGKIISSASNDPREYFGQFLLAYGKISEEDLLRIFGKQGETGIKLGRLLVMEGILSEEEVQRFLRIKAEETVYDLFVWHDGTFKFFNDAPAQENHVTIEMDVTSIFMEGTRRADEWARIREVFPSNEAIIRIVHENLTRSVLQDPLYNRLIQLMEAPRCIGDICLLFHASDFAVNKTLFDMYSMGIVEVVEARDREKDQASNRDEEIRSLCNTGLKAFNAEEYDETVNIFKHVLGLDPAHKLAKTMIQKSYHEMKAKLVSDEYGIDYIPYLKQSLDELHDLTFTPQENYILSRINGTSSCQSILRIAPIQEIQALLIFKRFHKEGIVGFLSPPNGD